MRVETLCLEGRSPRRWGEMHGESERRAVRELYAIRLELALGMTDLRDEAEALALAEEHLPVLERFDAALAEELAGIAAGSGLRRSQILLLNHYTDFRDLRRPELRRPEPREAAGAGAGGCSALYARTDEGAVLAETWDMHASAADYVRLLLVPGGPAGSQEPGRTLLLTVAGCVGMTGATSWGLGCTINNLHSVDARVGLVWPALVRRALRERSAEAARDIVLGAPLGSGHHYMLADGRAFYGIETSGARRKVTQTGAERAHVHANHCLDPEMRATCVVPEGSSSHERLRRLEAMRGEGFPRSARGVLRALGRVAVPPDPGAPHAPATCGAIAMALERRAAYACAGAPGEAEPLGVELG